MAFVVVGDLLASWGQVAAIILAVFLFISILTGLLMVVLMLLSFAWLEEKVGLLTRLRSQVTQLNQAAKAVRQGDPLPAQVADNRIISTVLQAPIIAENMATRSSRVEQNVDRGSERVASAVIEFYARTEMVKGMAKAFFLPGLTRRQPVVPVAQTREQEVEREQEQVAPARGQREEPPMEQEIVIRQR
ncbi:MAG TPA: hypothetical protein VF458_00935 [Ktedonobacteraceae bacterium]